MHISMPSWGQGCEAGDQLPRCVASYDKEVRDIPNNGLAITLEIITLPKNYYDTKEKVHCDFHILHLFRQMKKSTTSTGKI